MPDSAGPAAVQLRVSGAPWTEIARVLGFNSPAAARRIVENELAAAADELEPQTRDQMREEQAARLLVLMSSVWDKATDPSDPEHLTAANTALKVIDRHTRLLGLDQPSEMIVYNPTSTEIDAWIAEAISQGTNAELPEGDVVPGDDDIIEAEIVEG